MYVSVCVYTKETFNEQRFMGFKLNVRTQTVGNLYLYLTKVLVYICIFYLMKYLHKTKEKKV